MFQNEELKNHLETSSSIKSQPAVIAEWNMNFFENISTLGNYRYRPNPTESPADSVYALIPNSFDINDADNEIKFYTDATYADTVVDGGLDDEDQPIAFVQPNEKERLLYSLEDCIYRFRPRSGINKLRYFSDKFTHFVNREMTNRPRYYMPSKNDSFKYWTSYRLENGIERGISNKVIGPRYYIDDAAPFVVYKDPVPANRIVIKMQTNVGSVNLGPFQTFSGFTEDPFFGFQNQTTPTRWKVQYLIDNDWIDAISFDELSVRSDGSPIVGSDGYVELEYGLIPPSSYEDIFSFIGEVSSASLLPQDPILGSTYLVGATEEDAGLLYIWDGSSYREFVPEYGWQINDGSITDRSNLVKELVNAPKFIDSNTGGFKYREFQFIRGIRIVVETMNRQNSTFDLIEFSPRLAVDLTDKTASFSIKKSASDLGVSGMPVGQLLASTGSLEIFDYDQSFSEKNIDSIISKYLKINLQVKLYEVIHTIENNKRGIYYVPIKYMYADSFPEIRAANRRTTLELRDLFFYFESLTAPQILVENASVSYAISMLLDSIGFSNYAFLRAEGEEDPVIPYFFIGPDKSVAEVLQEIAVSTQTAMFFDEYNNFVMMTKRYIMPSENERPTDLILTADNFQERDGVQKNASTSEKLPNIISMTSSENKVYNAGSINYTTRYIQKTYGSLKQASLIDRDKTWIYRPALLWEVSGEQLIRSREEDASASSYALSAIPINSSLSEDPPFVQNGELVNNTIDFGEGIYWLGRYQGYFYANGEIIKFDAVEYTVSGFGDVWISSVKEYQNYYSQIGFGGKIYPTGRIKIYAEPFYEEVGGITVMQNGAVAKHGRGQFGTTATGHYAGLSPYWTDNSPTAPVGGIEMDSRYLFAETLEARLSSVYNESSNKGRVFATVDEPEKIYALAYNNNQWLGAGDGGKLRISSDGKVWQTVTDTDIDSSTTFYSVAYGNGLWMAAGTQTGDEEQEAALYKSTNRTDWTSVDLGFSSQIVHRIKYINNTWVALGNASEMKTSTDGVTWTTRVPNFDLNPKTITAFSEDSFRNITLIAQGNPAIFTMNNHGFLDNDAVKLSVVGGTLPDGLNDTNTYYIIRVDQNTFKLANSIDGVAIATTSAGSGTPRIKNLAVIATAIGHGMITDNVFHIDTESELPSGIENKTIYFARRIDNDRFFFSEFRGESLVQFSTAQTSVSHQLNRYNEASLYSIEYGNSTWVVVGSNGQMATSANLISWTPVNPGFGLTSIRDIRFGNRWVAVGDEGKLRVTTSNQPQGWESKNSTFGSSKINRVAYANSTWVIAGNDNKMARSSDGLTWSSFNPEFSQNIYDVAFGGIWVIAGDRLQVKTSVNLSNWEDQTTDNAGEILFETLTPHGLTQFDYVNFYTNGVLPSDKPKEQLQFNSISVGSPAVLTRVGHGLQNGDTIRLFTVGRLPAGLATGTTYYVRNVGEFTFNVSLTPDGALINTTASPAQEGTHSFSKYFVTGIQPNRRYYVTSSRLTPYTFTIAETREAARNGTILTAGGNQSGEHSVVLDLVPDFQKILSLSSNLNQKLTISTEGSHGLVAGDRIFFGVRSESSFVEKQIPRGLIRYAPYYVVSTPTSSSFTISDTLGGEEIFPNSVVGNIVSPEYACIVKNVTDEIIRSQIIVPNTTNIRPNGLLSIERGSGEILPETRVTAVRPAISKNVIIDSIIPGTPGGIVASSHGLITNDQVFLFTTGQMPIGLEENVVYFVERVDENLIYLKYDEYDDYVFIEDTPETGEHSIIKSLNDYNKIVVSPPVQEFIRKDEDPVFSSSTTIGTTPSLSFFENFISIIDQPLVSNFGKASISEENKALARSAGRNGIIKNFLAKSSFSETDVANFLSTQAGTIQSSAFVLTGPTFKSENVSSVTPKEPINFISYVYKELDNKFTHFGTRLRIIGRLEQQERIQAAFNSINYYQGLQEDPSQTFSIAGASAGLAAMVNPETNIGYYFEIVALSESNIEDYSSSNVNNILFYKIAKKAPTDADPEILDSEKAIPVRLWAGSTSIVVDDGTMVGQYRLVNEENPSVYDLSMEYENIDQNTRRFYLYINNRIVAVVDDTNPLPERNTIGMFVRGGAKAMFENIYAISNNYSQNTVAKLDTPINSVFGKNNIDVSESFRKYSISGMVQSTYLSGIGTSDIPKHNIYFDEFGTIMRECAYFNIRYDKAYPALYATISPTFNKIKGYTVSGFVPNAYGAEFLVFNHTDSAISLDETSGNYLRIQGVTFTQESQNQLTVDDYFNKISDFSNPDIKEDGTILSPVRSKQKFQDIKNSRITNGRLEFTLEAPYIQTQDDASEMMGWLMEKISTPRKAVGLQIFGMPILQLGDIVKINYKTPDNIEQVSLEDSRFVVYNIEYNRSASGPSMTAYLSEVK